MQVALGELEPALAVLRAVAPERPFYVRSRMLLARLLLQQKGDKRAYAQVFVELSKSHPAPHTLLLLGEAMMKIMEPERAIAAYEVRPAPTLRFPGSSS
jgi:tetratricopeptide repeat protein 21B